MNCSRNDIIDQIINEIRQLIKQKQISSNRLQCDKIIEQLLREIKRRLLQLNNEKLDLIINNLDITFCVDRHREWWHEEILSICDTVCRKNGLLGYQELYKIE